MAESAESVIIAIEARTGGFTPVVQQSATAFDNAMKQVESSATRMERQVGHAFNNTRVSQQILMHVARASADSFAAGTPPLMIFTTHLAQLAEAGAYAGGSLGRFGAFLSGGWGIALTAAVSVLGALVAGHRGAGEEAHRHETSEEALMRALRGEADAIDKVTLAMRRRNEEVRSAIELDTERIRHQEELARGDQEVAQRELTRLRGELETARGDLAATAGPHVGRGAEAAAGQAAEAQARIDTLTAQITQRAQDLTDAQTRMINLGIMQSRELTSHVGRMNAVFDVLQHNLENTMRRALAMPGADRAAITRQLDEAERRLAIRRAEGVRAAQQLDDAERGVQHRGHRGPGEDVVDRAALLATARSHLGQTQGNATASLRQFFQSAGINISPTQMAWCAAFVASVLAANNLPVARGPGGTPALNARGYLNYGSATTHPEPGDIVVLRDARGRASRGHVGFFEGFDPSGRVRVLGGNQGRAHGVTETTFARSEVLAYRRAPTAAEAQTQQQRAEAQALELAQHRLRDEDRFQNELASLSADILNARRQQVQTEEQAAAADIAAINAQQAERDQRIRAAAAERTQRDASQAVAANIEAGFLLAKSAELAAIQRANSTASHNQRLDEQRLQTSIDELNSAESVERARGALARTVAERRDSELRLLDYQHREELLQIEKLRLQQGLNDAQRAALDRREADANTRYSLAQEGIRRQYQGPLAQYFEQIPQGADAMNRALQGVAVDGLQQLNDGLAQAASRFLHLGGVAGHVLDAIISDLIQIVLRQAELAAFGGGNGAGGFGGFLTSLASMFGLGGGAAAAGGGGAFDFLGAAMKLAPGAFAGGGSFMINGRGGVDQNLLSVNGRPAARVSAGETVAVVPQGKALSFAGGRAAMGGGGMVLNQTINIDASGSVNPRGYADHIRSAVRQETVAIVGAASRQMMKVMPARITQYNSDGL